MTNDDTNQLLERSKELKCMYEVSTLIETPGISLHEILQSIVELVPKAWQQPQKTVCRITFDDQEYKSTGFIETIWKQSSDIIFLNQSRGKIEVFYLGDISKPVNNPFLPEEIILINRISKALSIAIERNQLQRNEDKYRDLVEKGNIAIAIDDVDGNVIYFNEQFSRLFGYTAEEIKSKSHKSFIHQDDFKRVSNYHKRRLQGKSIPSRYECKGIKKDGNIIHVEVDVCEILKKDGVFSGTRSFMWDITKRKVAEEALYKSEEELTAIFNGVRNGIAVLNTAGKITRVNKYILDISGYDESDIIGKHFTALVKIFPAKSIAKMLLNFGKIIKGNELEPYDVIAFSKNGKKKIVQIHYSIMKKDGKVIKLIVILQDITEFRIAEEKIKKSEKYFREMTENSLDIIIVLNKIGTISFASTSVKRFMGYNPEDIIGKSVFKFIHPSDLAKATLDFGKAVLSKEQSIANSFRVFHNDGSERILEGFGRNLLNHPIISGFVMNIHDVTKRKKTENIQKTLYNISKALNKIDNISELYTKIKDYISNVLDTTNFYVALYDKKENIISFPFETDEKDEFETIPVGKSLTDLVIKSGKALIADEKLQNKLTKQGKIDIVGTKSLIWLGVPLKIEKRVIGIVAVQSYDNPNQYSEKDLEILSFISDEIAIAINRKQSEEQIKHDLNQKNSLLNELHHRTKNNMQVITSMLHLQTRNLDPDNKNSLNGIEFIKNTFLEVINRINAMSLVHQKLYQANDLSQINLKDYIKDLFQQLSRNYSREATRITNEFDMEDIFIHIDSAIPIGLVLNELISNMFKHAFPNEQKGNVRIHLQKEKDTININYSDNGVGLPADIDPRNSNSLGLETMFTLVEHQLRGKVTFLNYQGLHWRISFSDSHYKDRV
jgi:PAS domain S-box-containing protein